MASSVVGLALASCLVPFRAARLAAAKIASTAPPQADEAETTGEAASESAAEEAAVPQTTTSEAAEEVAA